MPDTFLMMGNVDTLRAAADLLSRTRCTTWTCDHARAMADVLAHEARWAETDPEYSQRPEPLPVEAARRVLDGTTRRPK